MRLPFVPCIIEYVSSSSNTKSTVSKCILFDLYRGPAPVHVPHLEDYLGQSLFVCAGGGGQCYGGELHHPLCHKHTSTVNKKVLFYSVKFFFQFYLCL